MGMSANRYAAAFAGALTLAAIGAGGAWAQADQLPEGPGKSDLMEVCTQCHDVSVVSQKARTPDEWMNTVLRMQGMGANMDDAKRASILAYLNAHFGTGPAAAPVTPATPASPAAPAVAPATPATPASPAPGATTTPPPAPQK